ncbi:MAG: CDP-glucose 4,6-dehydratase [Zoogloeaceae bacterium]|jgi:CDP-glucose 4,6-dehydratase|nr:CDP-glucose 4,6-dehydratase [Zoogloeaceae bacterium]
MSASFWQGKRVLLTGHTGFKGGWLALMLARLGANVTGFALPPPTDPSLFELARIGRDMRSILADIRDAGAILSAMREARPEIILHLAAQPLVRQSYADPVETYATNVMGLVHLFEAARQSDSARVILNVTSDKCYENREWPWSYRENEPLGGHDPYSSSKACAELVTAAYRDAFFRAGNPHVATARAGNVIGGGDWGKDRLIPDILRAVVSGAPLRLRNPQAVRPWQHVLEPLSGYLLLAEKLYEEGEDYACPWNFGPAEEDARPVKWLVERLARDWQGRLAWETDPRVHPHEAHALRLDAAKARLQLGWRPRWRLETALARVVDWQQAWLAGKDMREFTLRQIAAHEEDVSA